MKKENKLYIEKMGCDFHYDDPISKISDMENHRYYIKNIEMNDGKVVDTIEVTHGARYNNKKVKDNFKLLIDTYYYKENGDCVRLPEIENSINDLDLNYTKENLLNIINRISKNKYDVIEIVERY